MVDGSARAGLTVPAQEPGPGAMSTLVSSSAVAHNGNSPALSGGFYLVYISHTLAWGKISHNCNQTWHDMMFGQTIIDPPLSL